MSGIGLFRNIGDPESYNAGDTIFKEGEQGNEMFVITEGEVDILIKDTVIETIGLAMPLGEMALIDGRPRSATAVAKTDCLLVRLDEDKFKYLVQQTPYFALQVMRIMVDRFRKERELLR
jgi:CRP-like cAMP-binding protein